MENEPPKPQSSPALALLLAFAPSAMVLGAIALWSVFAPKPLLAGFLALVGCVVSGICCFVSSSLLFRRRTTLTIVAGVLFLLLNGLISLFFGCSIVLGSWES